VTEKLISMEQRKSHSSAILSTTNLTQTVMQLEAGLHGDRPAANNLSHGTAQITVYNKYSQTFFKYFWKNSTNFAY
jgi:hypothetical protein